MISRSHLLRGNGPGSGSEEKGLAADPGSGGFPAWAAAWAPPDKEQAILACLARSRRMLASLAIEGGEGLPFLRAVRVFRSIAVLLPDGRVRSAELWIPGRGAAGDLYGPAARRPAAAALMAAAWDDRAELFGAAPRTANLREERTLIGTTPEHLARGADQRLRLHEMHLNALLRERPSVAPLFAPGAGGAVHRQLREEPRAALAAVIEEWHRNDTLESVSWFRAALDPHALDAMEAAGINGCAWYNWLVGHEPGSPGIDATLGLRRRQATLAYPLALKLFHLPGSPAHQTVRDAAPLAPAIRSAIRADARVVRMLGSMTSPDLGQSFVDDIDLKGVAQRLRTVPKGAEPKRGEWRAYFAASALAEKARLLTALWDESGQIPRSIMESCLGKWGRLDADALHLAASGLSDMAADLAANLVMPVAMHCGSMDVASRAAVSAVRALCSKQTAASLASSVASWHERQTGIRAALAAAHPLPDTLTAAGWPQLHKGSFISGSGLSAVSLASQEDLDREHEAMGHCVNTYAPACLAGTSHIVSFRDANGRSVSTAEIRGEEALRLAGSKKRLPQARLGALPPGVVQHRGPGNGKPSVEAQEALWEYVAAICEGKLDMDPQGLAAWAAARRTVGGSRACYDVTKREAVAAAWKAYRPLLPRTLSRDGPVGFVAALAAMAAEEGPGAAPPSP
jgi:hypothetical protein